MTVRPTICIVTPSFNQDRYLDEALRSVLAQRSEVNEFFVMDGGSTDNTAAILDIHRSQCDFVASGPDGGQSAALGTAFGRASSDILGWINSDDLLLPGALATVRRVFAEHPETDVVMGWLVFIDEDSRVLRLHRSLAPYDWLLRLGVSYLNQPAMFFRRRLFERIGGLNPALHCVMDADLWYRFLRANAAFRVIPRYLAAFRQHGDQKWVTASTRYREEHRWLAKQYPEYHPLGTGHRFSPGRLLYGALQLASLNFGAGWLETRRWAGTPVGELFGQGAR